MPRLTYRLGDRVMIRPGTFRPEHELARYNGTPATVTKVVDWIEPPSYEIRTHDGETLCGFTDEHFTLA